MQIQGGNLPFHIARAYAPQAPKAVAKPPETDPAVRLADVNPTPGQAPPNAAKLVAGVVPGRIDFSGDEPRPGATTLPFYRHPASANEAATAIQIGRSLDVSG